MALIARDGMAHLIRMVEIIILEKLQKLNDGVKDQVSNHVLLVFALSMVCIFKLFWLVRELVQTRVIGADVLCYAFLKQCPGW